MKNKILIYLMSAVLLVNSILVVAFVYQQIKIKKINEKISNISVQKNVNSGVNDGVPAVISSEMEKKIKDLQYKQMIDNKTYIIGEIVKTNESSVVVKTLIEDPEQLKDKDLTQSQELNLENVEYEIKFDNSTKFENIEIGSLKIGDEIMAKNDQTVFGIKEFTAKSIELLADEKIDNGKKQ